jgi:hypothetical protein
MESSTGSSANKLTHPRCLDRFRIASILALLVYMELVEAKDRTLSFRPFVVCILRMPFSFGLMLVGSAGLEYPPL